MPYFPEKGGFSGKSGSDAYLFKAQHRLEKAAKRIWDYFKERKMHMVKIGLIGAGRIGRLHGSNVQKLVPNGEIIQVSDPYAGEETEKWAKSLGIRSVTKDPEDIFANPEVDAVFICSSTDTHGDFIIRAAKAGKHIFCEKPIHTDISKIKEALKAVEEAGVKLQVGFVRRFDRHHKAVRDAVAGGRIGRPYLIKVTSRDPEPPSLDYVRVSGGIFLDMMIHDFDMVRYLSGAEVIEVSAVGACLVDPEISCCDDVDTAVVTLRFSNGAIGIIDNCRKASYGYDQRVEVHGEKGCVRNDNVLENRALVLTAEGTEEAKPTWFFLERYLEAFAEEEKAFTDAIEQNLEVPVSGRDGLEPVRIAVAAKKSLMEGRPVKLSEIEE